MRFRILIISACAAVLTLAAHAQTADELVAKNIAARGGMDHILAIHSLKTAGRMQQGGMTIPVTLETAAPDLLRQSFTIQGMTATTAYDGGIAWQISPFQGKKDPQQLGEDDRRSLIEEADFYGPLVNCKEKGNTVEYLGHATVDGDDALLLKVTLKNGDIVNYYLDPDTYLEIRTEKTVFIRGAMRQTVTDLGSYKKVAGVYFPFSMESGTKGNPFRMQVTVDSMTANVPLDPARFHMPPEAGKPPASLQPDPPRPSPSVPATAPVKPPR